MESVKSKLKARGLQVEVTIFENPSYDEAFLGLSENNRAIYDFEKMVECLVKADGMTDTEAVEFIEYNAVRALPYVANAPIILYRIED